MAYKYEHFIPQNIAPNGAKKIGVYKSNGDKVCTIPLGRLAPATKQKLYSFGLISDTHICPDIKSGKSIILAILGCNKNNGYMGRG